MISTCPLRITAATLVALRDNTLSPADAVRLREHVQCCPACASHQDTLMMNARLLCAHPLPPALGTLQRQDRLWRAVREQIAQSKERKANMSISRPTLVRGAGVVIGALVFFVVAFGAIQLLSRRPQIASRSTASLTHISTVNASTFALPTGFSPVYISPDGNTIIGYHIDETTNQYRSDLIERYTVSSGKLDPVYTAPSDNESIAGLVTDGRYVAWTLEPPTPVRSANPTSTPSQLQLMTLDLQTMQTQTIAQKVIEGENISGDYVCKLDHGFIFWQDMYDGGANQGVYGGMLKMTTLATGATTTISTSILAGGSSYSLQGFQEGWPNILLTTGPTQEQLMDITTGSKRTLVAPSAGENADPSFMPQYQFDGATVLASWVMITGGIDFALLDTTVANSPWQAIAAVSQPFTFPDDNFQANSRLIVFNGTIASNVTTPSIPLAWDRHLHRVLEFDLPKPPAGLRAELFGDWLLLVPFDVSQTVPDQHPIMCTLIDTRQLLIH